MVNIYYHNLTPGQSAEWGLLKSKTSTPLFPGLDVLVLELDSFFPQGFEPVVEAYVNAGTSVFLKTGQRGTVEQQTARAKEKSLIVSGAVSLGRCKHSIEEMYEVINRIFGTDLSLEEKVRQTQDELYWPAMESIEFGKIIGFLFNGGSIDIGKFVYCEYDNWLSVKDSPHYKPLSDAATESYVGIAAALIPEMRKRGICDYYSMGPSPNADKLILEEFVKAKQKIRYHAIDISQQALFKNNNEITKYLATIDQHWQEYVELINEEPQSFTEVQSRGKCCVAYPGGQIANNENFFAQASQICQEGGLVVADIHTRNTDQDDSEFWMHIYDIEEEKQMFRRAIGLISPQLMTKAGWDISVKYVQDNEGPNRVSFQLEVYTPITIECNMMEVQLEPGITRELMISRKYTSAQFEKHAATCHYDIVGANSSHIALTTGGITGLVTTAILSYKKRKQIEERVQLDQRLSA
ncbi:MAG: L-histidine N(alpha)-methyltransferase [Candidatus Woesearchaeota archaeon]|jgi:hypothetical protein